MYNHSRNDGKSESVIVCAAEPGSVWAWVWAWGISGLQIVQLTLAILIFRFISFSLAVFASHFTSLQSSVFKQSNASLASATACASRTVRPWPNRCCIIGPKSEALYLPRCGMQFADSKDSTHSSAVQRSTGSPIILVGINASCRTRIVGFGTSSAGDHVRLLIHTK